MTDFLTASNVTFILGSLGVLFGVYNYFRNPQIKIDKQEALLNQKADILAQSYERRFNLLNQSIKEVTTLAQNHLDSVNIKVDALTATVNQLGQAMVELRTIINERIPKK